MTSESLGNEERAKLQEVRSRLGRRVEVAIMCYTDSVMATVSPEGVVSINTRLLQ